jgi:hypothetical protein
MPPTASPGTSVPHRSATDTRCRIAISDRVKTWPRARHSTQPASFAMIYFTTTVPCMKGWIEQMYAYVPGVVKV